jgi:hypothetical protein
MDDFPPVWLHQNFEENQKNPSPKTKPLVESSFRK